MTVVSNIDASRIYAQNQSCGAHMKCTNWEFIDILLHVIRCIEF